MENQIVKNSGQAQLSQFAYHNKDKPLVWDTMCTYPVYKFELDVAQDNMEEKAINEIMPRAAVG